MPCWQRELKRRGEGRHTRGPSPFHGLLECAHGAALAARPADLLVVLLVAVLSINVQLYVFLTRRRGLWFTVTAVPFHLLYHFYNGICVVAGTALYWWEAIVTSKKSREASSTETTSRD